MPALVGPRNLLTPDLKRSLQVALLGGGATLLAATAGLLAAGTQGGLGAGLGALAGVLLFFTHLWKEQAVIQARLDQAHRVALEELRPLNLLLPGAWGPWSLRPDAAAYLIEQVLATRPGVVVECGSGYSSVLIGACLKRLGGGHLYSLEHYAASLTKTRGLISLNGLEEFQTLLEAPLAPQALGPEQVNWYEVPAECWPEGPIELLFIDGPPGVEDPQARYPALPLLWDRLAPGALILLDDGGRPGERQTVERWQSEFTNLKVEFIPTEKGMYRLEKGA